MSVSTPILYSNPYILRIEMGVGRGSGLNSLTMISYYSDLVCSIIKEGGGGSKENA